MSRPRDVPVAVRGAGMGNHVVQISILVSCAGVATRYVTQLLVVLWSLRANASGRRHAIELLRTLRRGSHERR
jgi:hypothetical protein